MVCLLGVLMLLGGCFGKADEVNNGTADNSSPKQTEESPETDENKLISDGEKTDTNESAVSNSNESANNGYDDNSNESSDSNTSDKEFNTLDPYSNEQIEYARVWLQLGANQDIDELNVRHIPAGEPINPNIDNSATYPEGVIQLSGSRLIDGSITYKGNGDGTINIYNAPMRWEAPPPDVDEKILQEDTEEILDNTKKVYIEPASGEDIIKLIKLQKPYSN